MTLGEKIIELRKKSKLTQEQLSEKLKISRQTLSNWENNTTTPDILQSKNIASFFNISLDDLTNNKLEVQCKNNSNNLLNKHIGKECFILIDADYVDPKLGYNTRVKILDINDNFIKIECKSGKKFITKLIDVDIITSIKIIEEESK